ncbi:hypothetical protein EMA8858_03064 [Emticicia aquatica]|jgi:hypothetical protein|uniref:DUF4249 domain-containing protein n=1 Tax=Emticicia aquatica TaxID=1681835 RepID=A0ABN8EV59_9BACT|nr:DUF4249 domain-containing protein [Emticicia aquatica]CAH0996929.1 hypothetical protein EMA8858_03064 [Emticicia aquatica]
MKKNIILLFLAVMMQLSCIEELELPYRNEEPILVVDGEVTNEAPPYNLRLSYSGKFVSGSIITSNLAVNGARVILSDEKGNSVRFKQNIYEPALYQTDAKFRCEIGRTYALRIEMPDGKVYITKPQLMKDVSPITNIYANKIKNFIRFYIDTKDPANSVDYYRWKSYSISLKSTIGPSNSNESGNANGTCSTSCWAYNREDAANIFSDRYINGNEIKKRLVLFSPIEETAPLSRHYAEVKQMSISQEAYLFWQQYEEQKTRTGSIFDPLPATIIGNIVNEKNDKDFALGFFGVSGVTTKRLMVEPANLSFSTEESINLRPPVVVTTRLSGNCETTYPSYGCTPPVEWK